MGEEKIERLAQMYGIELEYEDVTGRMHRTAPVIMREGLAAMGVKAATDEEVDRALEAAEERSWLEPAPVVVACESQIPAELAFQFSAGRGSAAGRRTALAPPADHAADRLVRWTVLVGVVAAYAWKFAGVGR